MIKYSDLDELSGQDGRIERMAAQITKMQKMWDEEIAKAPTKKWARLLRAALTIERMLCSFQHEAMIQQRETMRQDRRILKLYEGRIAQLETLCEQFGAPMPPVKIDPMH
jgi:hypothetical protein